MEKRVSPLLIGIFITGSLILFASITMLIASGAFFSETEKYILYFEGSAKGLRKGAPVAFKGVPIGKVIDIDILFDPQTYKFKVPVVIEIERGAIRTNNPSFFKRKSTEEIIQNLIRRGLRAQLLFESLVTGVLFINLDYYPDTEENLYKGGSTYMQIPTIPSRIEAFSDSIEKIDFQSLFTNLEDTVSNLEKISGSEGLHKAVDRFDVVVMESEKTLKSIQKMTKSVDAGVPVMVSELQQVSTQAQETFTRVNAAVAAIEKMVEKDSDVRFELRKTVKALGSASRATESLADYIERHPEALLVGKTKE